MKKKASLLISGITTVAMLAVAVGSFAAWDTLSGKTAEDGLKVNVGNPVNLKVTATAPSDGSEKLAILTNGTDLEDSKRSNEATLGTFKVELSNTDKVQDGQLETKFTSATVSGSGITDSNYSVVLYKDGAGDPIAIGDALVLADSGETSYTAKLKPASGVTEETLKADAGKEVKVVVTIDTAKKQTT